MVIPDGYIQGDAPALPFHGYTRERGGGSYSYHERVSRTDRRRILDICPGQGFARKKKHKQEKKNSRSRTRSTG
jgi:hypothetical protein